MRHISFFVMLTFFAYLNGAELTIPTSVDISVCVAAIGKANGFPETLQSIILHKDGRVSLYSEGPRFEIVTRDPASVFAARASIIDATSRFQPIPTESLGPGTELISVGFGNAQHILVMWAWNISNGIQIPPEAVIILDAVRPLASSHKSSPN